MPAWLTSEPERPRIQALRHLLALAEHNARNPGIIYLHTRLAAEAVAPDHPAHAYFEKHYALARGYAAASFAVLAGTANCATGWIRRWPPSTSSR